MATHAAQLALANPGRHAVEQGVWRGLRVQTGCLSTCQDASRVHAACSACWKKTQAAGCGGRRVWGAGAGGQRPPGGAGFQCHRGHSHQRTHVRVWPPGCTLRSICFCFCAGAPYYVLLRILFTAGEPPHWFHGAHGRSTSVFLSVCYRILRVTVRCNSGCRGTLLVNERMLETYLYARKNFLKPGGKMFPSVGRIHVAAFSDHILYGELVSKAAFWLQVLTAACFVLTAESSLADLRNWRSMCPLAMPPSSGGAAQGNFYGVSVASLHGAALTGYFTQAPPASPNPAALTGTSTFIAADPVARRSAD